MRNSSWLRGECQRVIDLAQFGINHYRRAALFTADQIRLAAIGGDLFKYHFNRFQRHGIRRLISNWSAYDEAFARGGAQPNTVPLAAGGLPLRTPAPVAAPALHVHHQYVIRLAGALRDPLREHLATCGVGSDVYYPLGLHQQQCFASLGHREGDLIETEAAAREVVALPIYPELTAAQRDHVVASVLEFVAR